MQRIPVRSEHERGPAAPSLARARYKLWLSYPLAVDIDSYHLTQEQPDPVLKLSLRGFRFQRCLQRTPLGEMWKVLSPDDQPFLAYFLPENISVDHPWVKQIQGLEHPGLSSYAWRQGLDGRLVQILPVFGKTLKERFEDCWSQSKPGVDPAELLTYLREVGITLHEIHQQRGFQHLALNPNQILVQNDRAQLTGFGQAELLWASGTDPLYFLNPFYSAPEVYRNTPSLRSDQFSMALIYAALVTGIHPLQKWQRGEHGMEVPQLLEVGAFSSDDRDILRKALHPDPEQRFASIPAFLDALQQVHKGLAPPALSMLPRFLMESLHPAEIRNFEQWVQHLLRCAGQGQGLPVKGQAPLQLDRTGALKQVLDLHLPADKILERVEQLAAHWNAFPPLWKKDVLILRVPTATSRAGLEVYLENLVVKDRAGPIAATLRPFGSASADLVQTEGPALLAQLREILLGKSDHRRHFRIGWQEPLVLNPVHQLAKLAQSVEARAVDISQSGIGLCVPSDLGVSHFYFSVPHIGNLASYSGLARVVRKQRLANGWYEIGASFVEE